MCSKKKNLKSELKLEKTTAAINTTMKYASEVYYNDFHVKLQI